VNKFIIDQVFEIQHNILKLGDITDIQKIFKHLFLVLLHFTILLVKRENRRPACPTFGGNLPKGTKKKDSFQL